MSTRTYIEVPCSNCGQTVSRTRHRVKHGKYFYCAPSCESIHKSKIQQGAANPNYKRVEVACTQCNKPLLRHPYSVQTQKKYFCDKNCRRSWHADRHQEHVVCRACKHCGKLFEASRWFAEHGKCTFCSRECMGLWNSANITGENHPQWKGGSLYDYGPNWSQQRDKVRERDNYTCQYCGKNESKLRKQLDVHHIKPFRDFEYVDGKNTNYLEANQLTNLISLCRSCHRMAEIGKLTLRPKLL